MPCPPFSSKSSRENGPNSVGVTFSPPQSSALLRCGVEHGVPLDAQQAVGVRGREQVDADDRRERHGAEVGVAGARDAFGRAPKPRSRKRKRTPRPPASVA